MMKNCWVLMRLDRGQGQAWKSMGLRKPENELMPSSVATVFEDTIPATIIIGGEGFDRIEVKPEEVEEQY